MKTTLTFSDFKNKMTEIRPDDFTYPALLALFAYFEDVEQDTGTEIEFDAIAICCEYTEYDSPKEVIENYAQFERFTDSLNDDGAFDSDEDLQEFISEIQNHTQVIPFYGGLILADF